MAGQRSAVLLVLMALGLSASSGMRLPFDWLSGSPANTLVGDDVSPEATRVQIQRALNNLSDAIRANDSASGIAQFSPSLTLLPPNHPYKVLSSNTSQERFFHDLASCHLRLQLTVADALVGKATSKSASKGELTAIVRIAYVAFTSSGGLADVGKAIALWNGTSSSSSSSLSGDSSKAYTWLLRGIIWSSDVDEAQRVASLLSGEYDNNEEYEESADSAEGTPLADSPAPSEAAVVESTLSSLSSAIGQGDIVGASTLLAPCFEILPPGSPRTVLTSSLQLTKALQRLVKSGRTFTAKVLEATSIPIKSRLTSEANCGIVSSLPHSDSVSSNSDSAVPQLGDDASWISASGVFNETDATTGEVLRDGKFVISLSPAPKDDVTSGELSDRVTKYLLKSAMWNYNTPAAPHNGTLESTLESLESTLENTLDEQSLKDSSPVDTLEQLRESLSSLTESLAANDTATASALLAPSVFVLAPGKVPVHLTSASDKAVYVGHLASKKLRLQLTIVDVAVGKAKAFAPIPSANSDDLIALSYVNYVAFTRRGDVADVGKLFLLWVRDSLSSSTTSSSSSSSNSDKAVAWKLYWLTFNSDVPHLGSSAWSPPNSLHSSSSSSTSSVTSDVKPAVILQQLSSAVEDLAAALSGNNTFLAARIFSPSAVILAEGEPSRTLTTQQDKEALFQPLVDNGLSLSEEFDEIVLADLTFLSDSPRSLTSDGGMLFAVTRGNYTITKEGMNGTELVQQGHVVQVWARETKEETSKTAVPVYGVRLALASHMPLLKGDPQETEEEPIVASSLLTGEKPSSLLSGDKAGAPLESPKPDTTKLELDAALKNLSSAACANSSELLLSIIGDNITVLAPGAAPVLLNETAEISDFFSSSFLPCGVTFIIADLAVGGGAFEPEPVTPTPSAAANNDDGYLAVTHLIYIDYATLSIGKALALWTMAGKKKSSSASNGQDSYFWNLTAIGWSSDLPAADAAKAAGAAAGAPLGQILRPAEGAGQRREMLEQGILGNSGGILGNDPPAVVRPGLETAAAYFSGNASVGDLENCTRLFNSSHPFLYMTANVPTEEFVTLAQREAFVQQILDMGYNWTIEFVSVWSLSVKESNFGLQDRSGGNAFTLFRLTGTLNGAIEYYGHSLALWDAVPIVADNMNVLRDSKAVEFALRWELFAATEPPAEPPTEAPAEAPAGAPGPAVQIF